MLGGDEDSTDLHLADTLAAGAGTLRPDAVRVLVDEGPSRVHELIAMGAVFDRLPGGALALAREGGHSTARVVHAGGAATGAEVERALVDATRLTRGRGPRGVVRPRPARRARAVLRSGRASTPPATWPRCARTRDRARDGRSRTALRGHHQPREATADGLAMALRAGVPVADIEFMQFHPTALHHPAMPRPLLSEALRGHGALLRDANGERFVDELAPRDVVSRGDGRPDGASRASTVSGSTRPASSSFDTRFPTIAANLAAIGLDPSRDWLPIAPAAHYLSGGVVTDLSGATALPGLWAAGEVACTGVHGANRLASNSLLEGMVFGARLAEAIVGGASGPTPTGVMRADPRRPHDAVDRADAAPWVGARPKEDDPVASPPDEVEDAGHPAAGDDRGGRRRPQPTFARPRPVQAVDAIGAETAEEPGHLACARGALQPGDHGGRAAAICDGAPRDPRGAHVRSDYPETLRARGVAASSTPQDGYRGLRRRG